MSDLIQRLRDAMTMEYDRTDNAILAAIDTIERLTAERERLIAMQTDGLAALIRQDERERCAKLADEYATWGGSNFHAWFTKLAAAIRASGEGR